MDVTKDKRVKKIIDNYDDLLPAKNILEESSSPTAELGKVCQFKLLVLNMCQGG